MKTEYQRVAAPAVKKVGLALKTGRLIKPTACADCHAEGYVQGHHHNGYGPGHELDVVWLCRLCHEARHHGRKPSWERSPRAYMEATGRTHFYGYGYQFSTASSPKHLLKTMRRLWTCLLTDEERDAVVALVQELAASAPKEGAA